MFGRATITLGIGPHSSFGIFLCCLIKTLTQLCTFTTGKYALATKVARNKLIFLCAVVFNQTWYALPCLQSQFRLLQSSSSASPCLARVRSCFVYLLLSPSTASAHFHSGLVGEVHLRHKSFPSQTFLLPQDCLNRLGFHRRKFPCGRGDIIVLRSSPVCIPLLKLRPYGGIKMNVLLYYYYHQFCLSDNLLGHGRPSQQC